MVVAVLNRLFQEGKGVKSLVEQLLLRLLGFAGEAGPKLSHQAFEASLVFFIGSEIAQDLNQSGLAEINLAILKVLGIVPRGFLEMDEQVLAQKPLDRASSNQLTRVGERTADDI